MGGNRATQLSISPRTVHMVGFLHGSSRLALSENRGKCEPFLSPSLGTVRPFLAPFAAVPTLETALFSNPFLNFILCKCFESKRTTSFPRFIFSVSPVLCIFLQILQGSAGMHELVLRQFRCVVASRYFFLLLLPFLLYSVSYVRGLSFLNENPLQRAAFRHTNTEYAPQEKWRIKCERKHNVTVRVTAALAVPYNRKNWRRGYGH